MPQSVEIPGNGIQGIVIAAGKSQRMGVKKQLMEFDEHSFLFVIIQKLLSVCDEVFAVLGFEAELIRGKVQKEIDRYCDKKNGVSFPVEFTVNPNFEKGMFTSLQAGIRKTDKDSSILYHFVDQPDIPLSFYKEFTGQLDENTDWLQPLFDQKKGHPLLFSASLKQRILDHNPNASLQDFYNERQPQTKYWSCKYPQILNNINTPTAYHRIRKN